MYRPIIVCEEMHGAVYFSYKGQIFSGKDLFLTRIAFFFSLGEKKSEKIFKKGTSGAKWRRR
jgi:hypothetical protein